MPAIHWEEKDQPLRDDVRLLGRLLGEVLKEQGGSGLFERVESARRAARRRRRGDPDADADLDAILSNLSPDDATEVIRAFSAYFGLVNLAERIHRIRRGRSYAREASEPQPGSFEDVLGRLAEEGLELEDLEGMLRRTSVLPVFTAHPTEAVRTTLLRKDRRIAHALVERLDADRLMPREQEAVIGRIRSEVTAGWQTEEHRRTRPRVADEVEHVLFYLSAVLSRIVGPFYEEIEAAIETVWGTGFRVPGGILRFASWVGGDMDGNPNVGPHTIRQTLARHREVLFRLYREELRDLYERLSQSPSRVGFDEAVQKRIIEYEELFPGVRENIPDRHGTMPYRVLLAHLDRRLEATLEDEAGAYEGPEGFLADILLIRKSLDHHAGKHAGRFRVERLVRRIETFGFHLATLDVRQDALVHQRVVGRLLGNPDFPEWTPEERLKRIEEALEGDVAALRPEEPDEETARVLGVMAAIGEGRRRYGEAAIGPYIISMARGPDDALGLLLLARVGGLAGADGQVPLDIAPLFETVDDLAGAGEAMRSLLENRHYRAHVEGRGNEQVVMLGYSDSNKDSGIGSSRWALYRAQMDLVEATRAQEVGLTLFHGRGGTISRGGSRPREAVLAEPPGAVRGRLRVTEQGEIIRAKFGLRGIAMRTLSLVVGGVLEKMGKEEEPTPGTESWHEALQSFADESRRTYQNLVYETEGFVPFFRQATPVDVIERLQIGSRPARRREGRSVADLRAIPWVFAWTQSRHILPGWYGVGSGLKRAAESVGLDRLREMSDRWPFFSNLLGDVEMVLAKVDMPIAARYAELAEGSGNIQARIEEEFRRTAYWVCRVRGQDELLDDDPVLRRAIRLRNPYVDPMSLLQVDLLRRWRDGDRKDESLEKALFTTVRGIARGMQNTG